MNYNPTIVIERDSAVGGWDITIGDVQVFFRDSVVAENFGAMLEHSEHILSLKESNKYDRQRQTLAELAEARDMVKRMIVAGNSLQFLADHVARHLVASAHWDFLVAEWLVKENNTCQP